MKDYVIDVLMNIGVPAGIKGFTYIYLRRNRII